MQDEARLKRLRMRSWRRGIKEMDLILGPWADTSLEGLDARTLDIYEAILAENDHDLYQWITARIGKENEHVAGPQAYAALLDTIAKHAAERL